MIKTVFLFLCLLLGLSNSNAQNDNNVTLVTSGSGNTIEIATQRALRSAIEQAYGAFISTKTEIFNDEIVANEFISVSNGNIQSYEILSKDELPAKVWSVTIRSVISVGKLISFSESRGTKVELNGQVFAVNIKQKILNEQMEEFAIFNLLKQVHEILQISFDYYLEIGSPKCLDSKSHYWQLPIEISVNGNNNFDVCINYLRKNLEALSLSEIEKEDYVKWGKEVFEVYFEYNGQHQVFSFRKKSSASILKSISDNWGFYCRMFKIRQGDSVYFGPGKIKSFLIGGDPNRISSHREYSTVLCFPSPKSEAAKLSWSDTLSVEEIEKIDQISVEPSGKLSQIQNGGIDIKTKKGHGYVIALNSIGKLQWDDAIIACADLESGGYDDWHLPSITELKEISEYSHFTFPNQLVCWTSSFPKGSFEKDWAFYFGEKGEDKYLKWGWFNVIAVRKY